MPPSDSPPQHPVDHMSADQFRAFGHAVVDWVADYQERVASLPVLSRVQPGEIRAQLPPAAPEHGEPFPDILQDVDRILLPGITHWQSPGFFAFFPANTSGPSILAELLSAGLGVQGMLWATSPACTELESHVLDWLVDLLALPTAFRSSSTGGGVIQDTASSAVLCALLAARERATGGTSNLEGCRQPLTAYTSTQTHSSVEKAMGIAGLGRHQLRLIPVDDTLALRPGALAEAIQRDRAAGCRPCFVCATVGTTSSHAIDPLRPIGNLCRQEGLWFHVDGAMAGPAALCPEFRPLFDGLELADSYCFNPHKWLFTNFDCSCFFVADRAQLIRTLSILPEYLKNQATASGAVIDYRDWQIQLGRRFRALKLWFVLRYYGAEGLRHHLRRHIELAHEFAAWVRQDPRFELCAPVPLNLVCFRMRADDTANESLLQQLNASGQVYLTHTRIQGRFTLRLCIGQTHTEARHVRQAWDLITGTAPAIANAAPLKPQS